MRRPVTPVPAVTETVWRMVRPVSLCVKDGGQIAEEIGINENNHAVEVHTEGAWLVFRVQEEPDSEVFEYAVPHTSVNYVAFWPEGGE